MSPKTKQTISNFVHAINFGVLAGGVIGALPPEIQGNKWMLMAQFILAQLMPSFAGVGHKVMTGQKQVQMKDEG